MNNVYLIPHDDGTYEACIAPVAPSENAVFLTPEGEYPIECYYRRLDANGCKVIESSNCTNQDKLIYSLNCHGQAFHTIWSLWDFDAYKAEYHDAWTVFNAATDKVMEKIIRGIDENNLLDYFGCVWEFEDIWEKDETDPEFVFYHRSQFIKDAIALILDYVEEHGCELYIGENDLRCVNSNDPEKKTVATGLKELTAKIREWYNESLNNDEINEEGRACILSDSIVIEELEKRVGCRTGMPIGTPTVKELRAILSKLPDDYHVSCCGSESYLYLNVTDKLVIINNERWLG